jgi:LacI family transcriptional regulator
MAARQRMTIREVAEAAGVSTQTVSRVLNNRPDVAPDTYERVRRVIVETGWAPNMVARSLTQGRSHILGVVAFGLDYFGPSRILTGIDQQAADSGYSLSLNLIHEPEADNVDDVLNGLIGRQVDGIVWAIPEVGENRAWSHERSRELQVPVVLVGSMAGVPSLPSIGIDNRTIARLATGHLLAGGVKRIAIVTGPLDWWEAQERLSGWRETLDAHGVPEEDRLVVEGDWSAASGERALDELIERMPDVDAVFASNDQMAVGVLHGAHRIGRRIPEDISVVGVDDIPESSHFWPSLTTVHQPLDEAGALAVGRIDARIREDRRAHEGSDEPASMTLLAPRLVVRSSSRPLKADEGHAQLG